MIQKNSIGIDLGGTNMRAGLVREGVLQEIKSARVNGKGSADEVLAEL